MDSFPASAITLVELQALQRTWPGPLVLDVRRTAAFDAADDALPGALRRAPEAVAGWADDLELARPVVVYCMHGHEVSQNAAAALAVRGIAARYLEGGLEGWRAAGGPLAAKPSEPSRWVTRARPKIDRIACPWLIRRFVDPDARFIYVPAADVLRCAEATGAVPFDVPDVAFSHVGEGCSFDAFIERYGLGDPALLQLAAIVRGADTERPDLAPEAPGLLALALGLSARFAEDDHACLRYGLVVYDALYLWARDCRHEHHAWPPAPLAAAAGP
jgi:rhodanese-related sulfurtransferase